MKVSADKVSKRRVLTTTSQFVAYYVKGDKVIAVSRYVLCYRVENMLRPWSSSMQNDPVVSKSAELMRLELMPSASEIRSGKVCEP